MYGKIKIAVFLCLLKISFNAHSGMWDKVFTGEIVGLYNPLIKEEINKRYESSTKKYVFSSPPKVPETSTICTLDQEELKAYVEISNRVSNLKTNNANKTEAMFHLVTMYYSFLRIILEHGRSIQDGAFNVDSEKKTIADELANQIDQNVQVVKGYVSKIQGLISTACINYQSEFTDGMKKYVETKFGPFNAFAQDSSQPTDPSEVVVVVNE